MFCGLVFEKEMTPAEDFSSKILELLTDPSEHVMTCLKLGLNTHAWSGSLWVVATSVCNTGLERKHRVQ